MFKKKLSSIISELIVRLSRLKDNLTGNPATSPQVFHTLTPVNLDNDATFNFYEDSLKWAINQKDCFNIAITGIYGSGKSSVLKTFMTNNQSYKYLTISLASFSNEKLNDDKLNSVEKSIIQQILYTVNDSTIPNSRFRRIKNWSFSRLIGQYLKLLISILLVYILLFPRILCTTPLSYLYDYYFFWTYSSLIGLLLFFFWSYFKKILRLLERLNVEKLNLKNGEITLKDASNQSILNEYLDELIYFFDKNPIDVVVFEDLDRFNNISIFTRLRELNLLINNNNSIRQRGKVVFIYAIKDELFESTNNHERVKFFDFILPIISVINSSNSYAKIKELLIEAELENMDNEFLQDIALYINDLRLLKNICNEYKIFKHLIRDQHGIVYHPENFFAMVVYKNYHPNDFNLLLKDQGQLHEIFSRDFKKKIMQEGVQALEAEIEELRKQITDCEGILELNKRDIQFMYLHALITYIRGKGYTFVNFSGNRKIDLGDLKTLNEADVELLFNDSLNCLESRHSSIENVKIELNKISFGNMSYINRLTYTSKGKESKINSLKLEIETLENEKSALTNRPIRDLFIKYPVPESSPKLLNDPMILSLLRKGKIEENYQLYISHYIEGGLTQNDRNFLLYVNDDLPMEMEIDFNFNLSFLSELLNRIHSTNFSKISILNFQLVDYLLEAKQLHTTQEIFKQFRNWNLIHQRFVKEYFERNKHTSDFLLALYKNNPSFINQLFESSYSLELKTKLLSGTVLRVNKSEVQNITKNQKLVDFLSTSDLILQDDFLDARELIQIINLLNLKIVDLSMVEDIDKLSEIVSTNGYLINLVNIEHIEQLLTENDNAHIDRINEQCFTELNNYGNEFLNKYIESYPKEFVRHTYSKLVTLQNEEEDSIYKLIDLCEDDEEIVPIILDKSSTIFTDINGFSNLEFQKYLIENKRFEPNWGNIVMYLFHRGTGELYEIEIPDELIDFISENIEKFDLSLDYEDESLSEDEFERFKLKLLLDDRFEDHIFLEFVSSSDQELIDKLNLNDIKNIQKLRMIIKCGKLKLTDENLTFLVDHYEELISDLIISQFEIFLSDHMDFILSTKHLDKIISDDKVPAIKKIQFIKNYDFKEYNSNNKIPKSILDLVLSNFDSIKFSFENYIQLLKYNDNKDQVLSKKVVLKVLETLDGDKVKIQETLYALNIREFNDLWDISKGTNEHFANSKENKAIFNILRAQNMVGVVKPKKNNSKLIVYKKHNVF